MQEITRHRPDDSFFLEAMGGIIQISKKVKAALQDIFKDNSTKQNDKINQIISDYQTEIYTLLDTVGCFPLAVK